MHVAILPGTLNLLCQRACGIVNIFDEGGKLRLDTCRQTMMHIQINIRQMLKLLLEFKFIMLLSMEAQLHWSI